MHDVLDFIEKMLKDEIRVTIIATGFTGGSFEPARKEPEQNADLRRFMGMGYGPQNQTAGPNPMPNLFSKSAEVDAQRTYQDPRQAGLNQNGYGQQAPFWGVEVFKRWQGVHHHQGTHADEVQLDHQGEEDDAWEVGQEEVVLRRIRLWLLLDSAQVSRF